MFRLLADENGFVHVCGHRGNSIASPENTLAALTATRDKGGTSAEIDIMLTADGDLVLLHDDFLDRTTDGSGLVSKARLADIRRLDAGSWFHAEFGGEQVPTLSEALEHARKIGIGLVVEVKDFQNPNGVADRLATLIERDNFNDDAILISFDHAYLKHLKERLSGIRTEGIVHARHANVVAVAQAAGLDSVSIEHMMFRPEDGEALHRAGVAVRVHLQRPDKYARYVAAGIDLLADARQWIADGVIDTISGDDVAFLADIAGSMRLPRATSP